MGRATSAFQRASRSSRFRDGLNGVARIAPAGGAVASAVESNNPPAADQAVGDVAVLQRDVTDARILSRCARRNGVIRGDVLGPDRAGKVPPAPIVAGPASTHRSSSASRQLEKGRRHGQRLRDYATAWRSGAIWPRSLEIALDRICDTRDSVSSRIVAISWSFISS